MAEQTINNFQEGLDLDTDVQYIKNTKTRESRNLRTIDVDGKGFVKSNIAGNLLDIANGKGWVLTAGFVPIGYDEYCGIAYIFSYNPTTNEGEVGTFPSPIINPDNTYSGGLERRYKPLRNFFTDIVPGSGDGYPHNIDYVTNSDVYATKDAARAPYRGDFRTNAFGFSCDPIRVVARRDYDDSVNIYFGNEDLPLRVINSGFDHQTGLSTDKAYHNNDSFDQLTYVFNETLLPPFVDLNTLRKNGKIKCGNVILYFRYLTESFDKTSFITESGPIQISPSDEENQTWDIVGGRDDQETNKSIVMRVGLSDAAGNDLIDRNYKYIEVAMVRYYGDNQTETLLINKLFSIEELLDTSLGTDHVYTNVDPDGQTRVYTDIEITGYEDAVDITLDEIIEKKRKDDVVKDFDELEGLLIGSNTKEVNLYDQDLEDFALGATLGYDDSLELSAPGLPSNIASYPNLDDVNDFDAAQAYTIDQVLHKNYQVTYRHTGHFRAEAYVYSMVYLLTNGKETAGFPMTGFDDLNSAAPGAGPSNSLGIYRFPRNEYSNFIKAGPNASIMGITFTFGGAVTQWMRDNVKGFYITRAPRKPNLLYQGVLFKTFSGKNIDDGVADAIFGTPRIYGRGKYRPGFGYPERWGKNKSNLAGTRRAPFIFQFTWPHSGRDFNRARLPWIVGYRNLSFFGGGIRLGFRLDKTFWVGPDRVIPAENYGKYGLFSPDFLFNNNMDDRRYYTEVIGRYSTFTPTGNLSNDDRAPVFGRVANRIATNEYLYDTDIPVFISSSDPSFQHYAECLGIPQWSTVGKREFVSYFNQGDGPQYNDDDENIGVDPTTYHFFYHYSKEVAKRTIIKNMAMGIASYIGVDYSVNLGSLGTGGVPLWANQNYMNLYDTRPDDITLENYYLPRSEIFHKITRFITLDEVDNAITPNITAYNGDCFISRTYIKTLGNPIYNPSVRDDDTKGTIGGGDVFFAFGHLLGMPSECAYNTAMRSPGVFPEQQEQEREDFYPGFNGTQPWEFTTQAKGREAYDFNKGYNVTLGSTPYAGFDDTVPVRNRHFPLRVFWTNKHRDGSFEDSWRVSKETDEQEFDQRLGPIIGVHSFQAKFFAIHREGITQLAVQERELIQTEGGSSLAIGEQKEVIHPKAHVITDEFGSQHQFGIIKTDMGLYGWDNNKRKIWMINRQFQFAPLSDTKFIRKYMHDTIEVNDTFSDVISTFGDSPVCEEGISVGYNRKYREVYFTVCKPVTIDGEGTVTENSETIIYNELIGSFDYNIDIFSPFYITIQEDFFSVQRREPGNPTTFYMPIDSATSLNNSRFWLHDEPISFGRNNYQTFYDLLHSAPIAESTVKFVVNDKADLPKVYDNIHVACQNIRLEEVAYETEYQQATHSPFNGTTKYIEPNYREGYWRIPIKRADTIKSQGSDPAPGYQISSRMRGRYIEITLKIRTRDPWYVKSVMSYFRYSKH